MIADLIIGIPLILCFMVSCYFLGSVVSWSSLKEVRSHFKRSHEILSISHEPPSKWTKTGNDEGDITSPILLEKEGSVNNEDVTKILQPCSESDVLQAEVNPPMDLSPIIDKLKGICNNTPSLDDKQIALFWEALASVQIDQVHNT